MVRFIELPTRADAMAAYTAAFVAGIPGWTNDGQNDPLYYAAGYLIDRGHEIEELVNRTARSVTLGLATGEDLDLLLIRQRQRKANGEWETDAEALAAERALLGNVSGFTEERVLRLLQDGDAAITDASMEIAPGLSNDGRIPVNLYIQGTDVGGAPYAPSTQAQREAAQSRMNSIPNESWFADYRVPPEERLNYSVAGAIEFNPDRVNDVGALRTRLKAALEAALLQGRRLGYPLAAWEIGDRAAAQFEDGDLLDVDLTLTVAADSAFAPVVEWDGGTALPHVSGGTPTGVAVEPGGAWLLVDRSVDKVFRSTDRGVTWDGGTALASANDSPVGVAVEPGGAWLVVDKTLKRIYRSTDRGVTWDGGTALASANASPTGVAVEPGGAWLVVDQSDRKIYRSTDRGATWDGGTALSSANDGPTGVAVEPGGAWLVVDQSDRKIYRSTDRGATWDGGTALPPVPNMNLSGVAVEPGGAWLALDDDGRDIYRGIKRRNPALAHVGTLADRGWIVKAPNRDGLPRPPGQGADARHGHGHGVRRARDRPGGG